VEYQEMLTEHQEMRSQMPHKKTLYVLDCREVNIGSLRQYAEKYGFEQLCLIVGKTHLHHISHIIALEGGAIEKDFDHFCITQNTKPTDVINNMETQSKSNICPLPQEGDAIICFHEHSLPAAYGISEQYNIYPASKNKDFALLDKLKQRECLSNNGLNDVQPKYQAVDIQSDDSLQEAVRKIGFPAVLKALGCANGEGVYLARTQDEFNISVEQARFLLNNKLFKSGFYNADPDGISSTLVLEEYLSHERGKEYCVYGNVFEGDVTIYGIGEMLFKQDCRDNSGMPIPVGHINLSLDSSEAKDISPHLSDWIKAFRYRNGLFCVDCMRMPDGKVKLLEANYRRGRSAALFEKAYRYSTEEALIANAAGEKFYPTQASTERGLGYIYSDHLLSNHDPASSPFPESVQIIPRNGVEEQKYVLVTADSVDDVKSKIIEITKQYAELSNKKAQDVPRQLDRKKGVEDTLSAILKQNDGHRLLSLRSNNAAYAMRLQEDSIVAKNLSATLTPEQQAAWSEFLTYDATTKIEHIYPAPGDELNHPIQNVLSEVRQRDDGATFLERQSHNALSEREHQEEISLSQIFFPTFPHNLQNQWDDFCTNYDPPTQIEYIKAARQNETPFILSEIAKRDQGSRLLLLRKKNVANPARDLYVCVETPMSLTLLPTLSKKSQNKFSQFCAFDKNAQIQYITNQLEKSASQVAGNHKDIQEPSSEVESVLSDILEKKDGRRLLELRLNNLHFEARLQEERSLERELLPTLPINLRYGWDYFTDYSDSRQIQCLSTALQDEAASIPPVSSVAKENILAPAAQEQATPRPSMMLPSATLPLSPTEADSQQPSAQPPMTTSRYNEASITQRASPPPRETEPTEYTPLVNTDNQQPQTRWESIKAQLTQLPCSPCLSSRHSSSADSQDRG
jgi:hypothetical protein